MDKSTLPYCTHARVRALTLPLSPTLNLTSHKDSAATSDPFSVGGIFYRSQHTHNLAWFNPPPPPPPAAPPAAGDLPPRSPPMPSPRVWSRKSGGGDTVPNTCREISSPPVCFAIPSLDQVIPKPGALGMLSIPSGERAARNTNRHTCKHRARDTAQWQ